MEGCPEGGNAVLTRRMAKKQHCPLMPTTKSYEYHANGTGIAYEVIEYSPIYPARKHEACRICLWRKGQRRNLSSRFGTA